MQLDKSPNVPLFAGSDLVGLVFSLDALRKSYLHPEVLIVLFGIICQIRFAQLFTSNG